MKSIAAVLLIGFCMAADLVSDIFIRGNNLDGKNGISAHSWDVITSLGMGFGAGVLLLTLSAPLRGKD